MVPKPAQSFRKMDRDIHFMDADACKSVLNQPLFAVFGSKYCTLELHGAHSFALNVALGLHVPHNDALYLALDFHVVCTVLELLPIVIY